MTIRLKRRPDGNYATADGRFVAERRGASWSVRDSTGRESLRHKGSPERYRRTTRSRLADVRVAIGDALAAEEVAKSPRIVDATVTGGRL